MNRTTPNKQPMPAHRALCEVRREISGIDKIIARREAEVVAKKEERERLVATGRMDDAKILAQISAHDIQLSMFPHLLKNLEEQKLPLRARYNTVRGDLHAAALAILQEVVEGLMERIEAALGVFCGGPRLRQQITAAFDSATAIEPFIDRVVESAFRSSELGIAVMQLRAALPPTPIATDGEADTWIQWGSEVIALHGEWCAFIEDAERIAPKNAA